MDNLDVYFKNIPYNTDVKFSKNGRNELPAGFIPSIGEPKFGCVGHYRRGLIHVLDMQEHWLIHKDHFNPETHLIQHLVSNAPHWLVLGAIIAGGLVSLALGKEE